MTRENKHPDQMSSLHFVLGQGPLSVTRYEEILLRIQRLLTGTLVPRTIGGSSQSANTSQMSDLSLSSQGTLQRIQNISDTRTRPTPFDQATSAGSMGPLNFASSSQLAYRGLQSGGFNVYGFGANKPGMPPSHMFPISQRGNCNDVTDFSRLYRHSLTKWRLSGPRFFAPVIEEACALADREVDREAACSATLALAQQYSDPLSYEGKVSSSLRLPPAYTVLLLLTCGPPVDLMETLDALEHASTLPLSIVIVDVNEMELGNDFRLRLLDEQQRSTEDMRQMYTFLAHLNGKMPERQNVHLVKYRRHPLMGPVSDEELMLDILHAVPAQYLQYCRAKGFEAQYL